MIRPQGSRECAAFRRWMSRHPRSDRAARGSRRDTRRIAVRLGFVPSRLDVPVPVVELSVRLGGPSRVAAGVDAGHLVDGGGNRVPFDGGHRDPDDADVLAAVVDEPAGLHREPDACVPITEIPRGDWGARRRVLRFADIAKLVLTGAIPSATRAPRRTSSRRVARRCPTQASAGRVSPPGSGGCW